MNAFRIPSDGVAVARELAHTTRAASACLCPGDQPGKTLADDMEHAMRASRMSPTHRDYAFPSLGVAVPPLNSLARPFDYSRDCRRRRAPGHSCRRSRGRADVPRSSRYGDPPRAGQGARGEHGARQDCDKRLDEDAHRIPSFGLLGGASRQAGASGKGEVHLNARRACGDLQRFIGGIEGKQGLVGLVEFNGVLAHGSCPFVWECQCYRISQVSRQSAGA